MIITVTARHNGYERSVSMSDIQIATHTRFTVAGALEDAYNRAKEDVYRAMRESDESKSN